MRSLFSSHPTVELAGIVERIEALLPDLPKQEARVAQYMLLNIDDLVFQNGVSIARKASTSEVTVSRLLSRLGYRGMAGLKRELQSRRSSAVLGLGDDLNKEVEDGPLKQALDGEVRALISVYAQTADPRWSNAVRAAAEADTVFVTGFQTVRGIAEDFTRRLALMRENVRFISAHDGMLGEWIGDGPGRYEPACADTRRKLLAAANDCVIIIDVVPYAREAPLLAEMSRDAGRHVIVLTDEFCHWAQPFTEWVFHAPSRNGLMLESTGALVSLANVLVHGIAEYAPKKTEHRLRSWQAMTRKLNVF
jgi:DNA-binding MurR/RpiR family transcriptional regulator